MKEKKRYYHPEDHEEESVEEVPKKWIAQFHYWEDDPEGEKPNIIILIFTLQSLEWQVCWDQVAADARQQTMRLYEWRKEQQEYKDEDRDGAWLQTVLLLHEF